MRSNAPTTLDHESLKSEVSLHYAIVVTAQYSNMFFTKTVIALYICKHQKEPRSTILARHCL